MEKYENEIEQIESLGVIELKGVRKICFYRKDQPDVEYAICAHKVYYNENTDTYIFIGPVQRIDLYTYAGQVANLMKVSADNGISLEEN